LLPLSDDILEKLLEKKIITSDMTVKEIRAVVKQILHGEDAVTTKEVDVDTKEDINEEDIPMAYDPTQEYDFEYFKSKSKSQLLNIVWELQKAYQKIKNTKKGK
jgi:prolyl oligopeptidase PreP (S9A serine peptidase family)